MYYSLENDLRDLIPGQQTLKVQLACIIEQLQHLDRQLDRLTEQLERFKQDSIDAFADLIAVSTYWKPLMMRLRASRNLWQREELAMVRGSIFHERMTSLYDKLPKDTRDAILCEAAASTMLEGMDHGAAMLREKAAKLRAGQQMSDQDDPL